MELIKATRSVPFSDVCDTIAQYLRAGIRSLLRQLDAVTTQRKIQWRANTPVCYYTLELLSSHFPDVARFSLLTEIEYDAQTRTITARAQCTLSVDAVPVADMVYLLNKYNVQETFTAQRALTEDNCEWNIALDLCESVAKFINKHQYFKAALIAPRIGAFPFHDAIRELLYDATSYLIDIAQKSNITIMRAQGVDANTNEKQNNLFVIVTTSGTAWRSESAPDIACDFTIKLYALVKGIKLRADKELGVAVARAEWGIYKLELQTELHNKTTDTVRKRNFVLHSTYTPNTVFFANINEYSKFIEKGMQIELHALYGYMHDVLDIIKRLLVGG